MGSMFPDLDGFSGFAEPSMPTTGALGAFLGIYLIVVGFTMVVSVVMYVLQALGMYTIAKRRGIHHPWMSWLPLLCLWMLGSISDQYQFVAKGKVRSRRKVLVGLSIASVVLVTVMEVVFVGAGIAAGMAGAMDEELGIGMVLGIVLFATVAMVLAIVQTVFQYIAYYDLFASCNPSNAVAFLIIGIFFSLLMPIFVFVCRNQDLGMPPRKPQLQTPAWQPPAQQQTWQAPAQQQTWQPPAQQQTWQPPAQQQTWQPPVQQQTWQPPAQQQTWQAPAQQQTWQAPAQQQTWQAPAQQPVVQEPVQQSPVWESPVYPVSAVEEQKPENE